jgi:ribosomal subunit interface protein
MQIQINTNHNIEGYESLAEHVTHVVEKALSKKSEHITRIEVHMSDENSNKGGLHDKRCMMEARLQGRAPLSVTHHAESLHQAIDGAVEKLVRIVNSTLDRLHDQTTRAEGLLVPESPTSEVE